MEAFGQMKEDLWLEGQPLTHILTPKCEYSPRSSGAIATVAFEYGRVHCARGGTWNLIASDSFSHDYGVGEVFRAGFPSRGKLRKRWRNLDGLLARIGAPRVFGERLYGASAQLLTSGGSDAVFLHNSEWGVPAARRKIGENAPLLLWMHNEWSAPFDRRETARLLGKTDGVIGVSQFLCDRLSQTPGAPKIPFFPLLNGVDTARFHPPQNGERGGMPTILFVARIARRKGIERLLEAAEILAQSPREFRVRVVGSAMHGNADAHSDLEKQLRARAQRLGEKIEWLGYRDRAAIALEYQRADIFCAPAQWNEPCGLTISEALSSGCAVVTTRRGGIAEVAGDAALYFPHENAGELAEILGHLVDDESARSQWQSAARARALLFSWETQYDKLRALLQ